MYEDLISEIESEISYLQNDEEVLLYVARKRKTFIDLKEAMKDLLDSLDDFAVLGGENSSEALIKKLIDTMLENAENALTRTKEFDLPQFSRGLFDAIRDPKTYSIIGNGSGLAIIQVNLDTTAGMIDDYARAVSKTREQLKAGPYRTPPMSPDMASEMWKNKYYRPAREGRAIPQPKPTPGKKKKKRREYNTAQYIQKYYDTIYTRMSYFTGRAPWWRILNYGTTPLESDWGGTEYPRVEPTYFVEDSIKKVQADLTDQQVGRGSKSTSSFALDFLNQELDKVNQAVRYLDELEERMSYDIVDEIEEPKTVEQYTKVSVKRQLGSRFGSADILRLKQMVVDLEAGVLDPNKRVELTKRGGERVRVRVKNLARMIQEFESEE